MQDYQVLEETKKFRTSILMDITNLRKKIIKFPSIKNLKKYFNELLNLYHKSIQKFINKNEDIDLSPYFENYDSILDDSKSINKVYNKELMIKQILLTEYSILVNMNNAYLYLLDLKGEIDSNKYFSGIDLNEINDSENLKKYKNTLISSVYYDIDIVELIDINNQEELNLLIKNQYEDLYLLYKLANSTKENQYNDIDILIKKIEAYNEDINNEYIITYYKIFLKVHYPAYFKIFRSFLFILFFILLTIFILKYNYRV